MALLSAGVLIVLVYIWSGESIPVLVLSIVTLFAVLFLMEWRPWDPENASGPFASREGSEKPSRSRNTGRDRNEPADRTARGRNGAEGPDDATQRTRSKAGAPGENRAGRKQLPAPPPARSRKRPTVARADLDVTWDDRGVSGVPVGQRAPRMWSWASIDEVGAEVLPDRNHGRPTRTALRIDLPDAKDPMEPVVAWLSFGPEQVPDEAVESIKLAWRSSKRQRSELSTLSAEDRTRRLADDLSVEKIRVPSVAGSPDLLYQELRSTLLATRSLRPVAADAELDLLLDAFDELLAANDMHGLTRHEVRDLEADRKAPLDAVHQALDAIAEQRGSRLIVIDNGGAEFLFGLVPADRADDWDGQEIGDGSQRVLLDLPRLR